MEVVSPTVLVIVCPQTQAVAATPRTPSRTVLVYNLLGEN